jgi:nitroreductase
MWKYTDSGVYGVVLIEAGFIGQNIALTATQHGLVANPTSAIHDDEFEAMFNITALTHSALLAMVIGVPDRSTLPVRPTVARSAESE